MYNPTPTTITSTGAQKAILVAALTDPQYVPVTKIWVGDAAQVTSIPAGTIVAEVTAGADAGKVTAYDAATAPDAIGVLHSPISVGELYSEDAAGTKAATDAPVTVFVSGGFNVKQLTGLDAAAEATLGGVTSAAGVFRFGLGN